MSLGLILSLIGCVDYSDKVEDLKNGITDPSYAKKRIEDMDLDGNGLLTRSEYLKASSAEQQALRKALGAKQDQFVIFHNLNLYKFERGSKI